MANRYENVKKEQNAVYFVKNIDSVSLYKSLIYTSLKEELDYSLALMEEYKSTRTISSLTDPSSVAGIQQTKIDESYITNLDSKMRTMMSKISLLKKEYYDLHKTHGTELEDFEQEIKSIKLNDFPFILIHSLKDSANIIVYTQYHEQSPIFKDIIFGSTLQVFSPVFKHTRYAPPKEICNYKTCNAAKSLFLTAPLLSTPSNPPPQPSPFMQTFLSHKYKHLETQVTAERQRLWSHDPETQAETARVAQTQDFMLKLQLQKDLEGRVEEKCKVFRDEIVKSYECKTWSRCGRCRRAFYCSRHCQVSDHAVHKQVCRLHLPSSSSTASTASSPK